MDKGGTAPSLIVKPSD